MRAGKFDRWITIWKPEDVEVDDYGTPTLDDKLGLGVRAQLIEQSTEEFLRSYGETDQTVAIFRIRWRDGITTDNIVKFEERRFNLREVKQIGRRKGLELRCEEVRT